MHVAAGAPETEEGLDPQTAAACLGAERLARQIVLAARDEAERLLAGARRRAAEIEAALVEEARDALDGVVLPPPSQRHVARLAESAGSRSDEILQRALERAARVREAAEAEAAATQARARQRRGELERELRRLAEERDDLVRTLEARVAAVRAAGRVAVAPGPGRRLRLTAIGAGFVATAALAGAAGWALSTSGVDSPPAAAAPAADVSAAACPIPARFRGVFVRAARREGLPLALLTAVANVESRWSPQAQSAKGAIGLMQLLPATATSLHVNPYRWRANVLGGARYLRQLVNRFGGNTELALAAYEAGPTRVAQGTVPLETLLYVGAVMAQQAANAGCR